MKFKVLKQFMDLKHNVMRDVGDEFTDTKERGEELKVYELVKEMAEVAPAKKPKKVRE